MDGENGSKSSWRRPDGPDRDDLLSAPVPVWLARRGHIDAPARARIASLSRRGHHVRLLISIMSSAMHDVDAAVFHMVDQSVLLVDAAAVFALQVTG